MGSSEGTTAGAGTARSGDSPLLALLVWWGRNRVRRARRRLTEPRYLVGGLAVLLYFGWLFGMRFIGDDPPSAFGGAVAPGVPNLWATGLLVLAGFLSVSGPGSAGLQISNAEAQFLLAAPLSRSALIRFKLVQSGLPLLFSAAIFTLFASPGRGLGPLATFLGFWLVTLGILLVRTRASVYEADARRLGISLLRRAPLLPGLIFAGVAVLGFDLWGHFGGMAALDDPMGSFRELPVWASGPVPNAVLIPLRPFTTLFFADDPTVWLGGLVGALAVLGALGLAVTRIDVPFEEASLESAIRRARIRKAAGRSSGIGALFAGRSPVRKGGNAPPLRFRMPAWGPPEVAILWKNVAAFQRHPLSRAVRHGPWIVLGGFVLLTMVSGGDTAASANAVAVVLGILAAYVLAIGPIAVRNDLRGDLEHVELLRSYPLGGQRVVAASIAGSVLTLLVVEGLIALMAAGFLGYAGTLPIPGWALALAVPGAVLAALPILVVATLLHNLIALYFPGWFRPGVDRGRGIEAMGLRIVTFIVGLLLLVIGVGIPGLAAFVVAAPLWPAIGPWALVPGVGAYVFAVSTEVAFAVDAMGRRWDRLDPAEIRSES